MARKKPTRMKFIDRLTVSPNRVHLPAKTTLSFKAKSRADTSIKVKIKYSIHERFKLHFKEGDVLTKVINKEATLSLTGTTVNREVTLQRGPGRDTGRSVLISASISEKGRKALITRKSVIILKKGEK